MSDAPIVFRTEGSRQIGLGHVRRCLSLAWALSRNGIESIFLLGGDPEAVKYILSASFEALALHQDDMSQTIALARVKRARAIVVDSYAPPTEYFFSLANEGFVTVAIDDLADRELPVDLVVNGTVNAAQLRYRGKPSTKCLAGPSYLLLRPEFAEPPARQIEHKVRRVLISLGGADAWNLTPRLMRWTRATLGGVVLDVVIGPMFDNVDEIVAEARDGNGRVNLHVDPPHMRDLMLRADVGVCGGGQMTYEFAATGLPAVAIQLANNQIINLKGLSDAGTLIWVGNLHDTDLESRIRNALGALAADPARRQHMSERGRALVDGHGAERVAGEVAALVEAAWT